MWVYLLIGIVSFLILYFIFLVNLFIKWSNKVKEAFSTMDVYLKKRWDLIPNLVSVVKGYASHESETLESVVQLRNSYNDLNKEDKVKSNEELNEGLQKIMILVENYPELKADKQFQNLMSNLTNVEDEIANSRKYYNAVIRIYNNKIQVFPNNIIAKVLRFKKEDMFLISDNEKENVSVKL